MRRAPSFGIASLVAGVMAAASVEASSALSSGYTGSLLGFAQTLDDARSAHIVAAAERRTTFTTEDAEGAEEEQEQRRRNEPLSTSFDLSPSCPLCPLW